MLERNLSCMRKRNERSAHPRKRKSFNLSGETRKRVIKLMIIILGRVELFGTSVKGVKRLLTERTTRPHGRRGDSAARNAVNSLVTRTNSIICVCSCHPKCCSRVMCVILIVFVANCGQQGVQKSNCQCSLRIAMVYMQTLISKLVFNVNLLFNANMLAEIFEARKYGLKYICHRRTSSRNAKPATDYRSIIKSRKTADNPHSHPNHVWTPCNSLSPIYRRHRRRRWARYSIDWYMKLMTKPPPDCISN